MSDKWSINGLSGVIGMLTGAFHRFRGVTAEVTAAFGADDGRESLRFRIRKRIYHDIFDPIGVVTRTAAVFVPAAGIGIEFQKLVPYRVCHIASPEVFAQTIDIL